MSMKKFGDADTLFAGMGADPAKIRWLRAVHAETVRRQAARRDRVLRHPDLCEALCTALTLTDASQWTGYVPPYRGQSQMAEPVHGTGDWQKTGPWAQSGPVNKAGRVTDPESPNDDPRRKLLVAICAEAFTRDGAEPEPGILDLLPYPGIPRPEPEPVQAELEPEPETAPEVPLRGQQQIAGPGRQGWPAGSHGEQVNR